MNYLDFINTVNAFTKMNITVELAEKWIKGEVLTDDETDLISDMAIKLLGYEIYLEAHTNMGESSKVREVVLWFVDYTDPAVKTLTSDEERYVLELIQEETDAAIEADRERLWEGEDEDAKLYGLEGEDEDAKLFGG